MKIFKIQYEEEVVNIVAQQVGHSLWCHFDGETRCLPLKKESAQRSGQKVSAGSGTITAPMPGKIIKTYISAGDMVKKGEDVLVLEAMKMEYHLKAEVDGKVGVCDVNSGDQVTLGQVLVTIETETTEE